LFAAREYQVPLTSSAWVNATVFIVILALGTAAFGAGWLGGGDVKLLAGIGLWLDLRAAPGLLAAVFIAGGIVALTYIFVRRFFGIGGSVRLGKGRIAYGIAIAVGALFIFATQLHEEPSNPFLDRLRAEKAARH
jgi:prepilin peptidase CpaA